MRGRCRGLDVPREVGSAPLAEEPTGDVFHDEFTPIASRKRPTSSRIWLRVSGGSMRWPLWVGNSSSQLAGSTAAASCTTGAQDRQRPCLGECRFVLVT